MRCFEKRVYKIEKIGSYAKIDKFLYANFFFVYAIACVVTCEVWTMPHYGDLLALISAKKNTDWETCKIMEAK